MHTEVSKGINALDLQSMCLMSTVQSGQQPSLSNGLPHLRVRCIVQPGWGNGLSTEVLRVWEFTFEASLGSVSSRAAFDAHFRGLALCMHLIRLPRPELFGVPHP